MARIETSATIEEAIPAWGRFAKVISGELAVDPEMLDATLVDRASGWPARALWMGWSIEREPGWQTKWSRQTHWGITIKQPSQIFGDDGIGLPLHPLWPGFAVNTILYAAISWGVRLLAAAPFAIRRRRRVKRGLCPACAYPIGTSEVCTECGTPKPVAVRVGGTERNAHIG